MADHKSELTEFCTAMEVPQLEVATPDARPRLWREEVAENVSTDESRALLAKLAEMRPDRYCRRLLEAAEAWGSEWACPSLCPATDRLGQRFLDGLDIIASDGPSPSEDAPLVALLETGFSGAGGDGSVPVPTPDASLQVLGGATVAAEVFLVAFDDARQSGFEHIEAVAIAVPPADHFAASPVGRFDALGAPGGFASIPRGRSFLRPAAVHLALETGLPEVRVRVSNAGFDVLGPGGLVDPDEACGRTVCADDWTGLYDAVLSFSDRRSPVPTVLHVEGQVSWERTARTIDAIRAMRSTAGPEATRGMALGETGIEGAATVRFDKRFADGTLANVDLALADPIRLAGADAWGAWVRGREAELVLRVGAAMGGARGVR